MYLDVLYTASKYTPVLTCCESKLCSDCSPNVDHLNFIELYLVFNSIHFIFKVVISAVAYVI